MDNNTLAIYINELRNQCINVEASFNLFNQALASQAGPGILFASQMIMMPASQMSAMLWPTRARARGRGESLRKVLQLPEKHALNDRRLAEMWERTDEKTDEWIAGTKGEQVLFDFVGNPKAIGDGNTPDNCIFRAYDPTAHIFYYRGVGYNVKALADAMSDVAGRVNNVYRQLFPDLAKADDEARQKALEAQKAAQAASAQDANTNAFSAAPDGGSVAGEEKKAPAKKTAPKKAAAKKPAAKAAAKKAPAKKPAPKKASAKKAAPKKAAAKKPAAKK
ncbi:hypothetical protein [Kordiimonas aquimaris]|uniref:hypothetical protein n=1 Tax=Kordiimonas aquimaris TaxID=707591 RepID=UPI0021D0CE12|nr:hypothetical protein [Kordiimonas aquimaris]